MKTKNISLKWQIFQYLCFFAGILIVLLWLLQTVFLNDFYRAIKVNEIKSMSNEVEAAFRKDDQYQSLMDVMKNYYGCVVVADSRGYQLVSGEYIQNCPLVYMKDVELKSLMIEALVNGGSQLKEYEAHSIRRQPFLIFPGMNEPVSQHIIFTKVITVDNIAYGIFLNTNVIPLDATVQTIQYQLIAVTGVMVVLALILALLIAKHLTKPIMSINASSRELAKGKYDTHFDDSGYKEIAQLAETLNFASHELGKVDRMQKELIANISHDLRTPLTMISGYSELMRDLPNETTKENIQTIIDEAKRLTSLVNDVLDISKLQAGSQELQFESMNLTQFLRDIVGRYTTLMAHEGYQITFEGRDEVFIYADELKLTQVIYNLMNNALTYTGDDKQVVVSQEVIHSDGSHQNNDNMHNNNMTVTIRIADTGDGIPADQLENIWDRYYKIDKSHRRAQVGSGLGLSIVKNILELHEASFGVESIQGQGSTFWFTFACMTSSTNADEIDN